jgi:D-xylose reductase
METLSISPTIILNNGYEMPRIGLGTAGVKDVATIVYESIKDGLRMIDTAECYENEKEIGEGISRVIKEGIVKREDLFIVTKLWVNRKHEAESSIKEQLDSLGLDYVDLYLDHWPMSIYKDKNGEQRSVPSHKVWKQLEDLVNKGYTKSIGVCNYNVQSLMDLLSYAEIKPVINQFENHPYLNQRNLVKYCQANNIQVMAYNSICRGGYVYKYHSKVNLNLLEEELIKEIAEKYNTNPGLIALNWALSQELIVIPSTSNPRRMKENMKALEFQLADEDLEKIGKLNNGYRFCGSAQFKLFSGGVDVFA